MQSFSNQTTIFDSNNYLNNINYDYYQEYYLIKDNIIYKFTIEKNNEDIFIKCKNYFISVNQDDLALMTKVNFNSINNAYEFIFDAFEENKVSIKDIIIKKEIKIIIENKGNKGKEIELILKYFNQNINSLTKDIKKMKNEIKNLKEENKFLKNEIYKLYNYHVKNNPKNIRLKSKISNDSYAHFDLDNSFTVFNSINNILYLIYSNKNNSIICYDLIQQKKIKELNQYHNKYITNFRHYLDIINKRDLLMSISSEDNNLRIWNVNNWNCILNLNNINNTGFLFSACLLRQNNEIYIITSNTNNTNNGNISEPIKVFNLNGQKINEINNSNQLTFFIDNYYDYISSKHYIIACNYYFSQSFDFIKNDKYHKYTEKGWNYINNSIVIYNDDNIIKLITSSSDGYIRIFNFHSGLFLNKIQIAKNYLFGMCLWNENYLFVGCKDKSFKLIELKNGLVVKTLVGHNNDVLTIKKINHPQLGECLISQNWKESELNLWINEN